MEQKAQHSWPPLLSDPSGSRENKPRKSGITMIIDKGLGLNQFSDLIHTSAPYIDIIKLGFGTSALYPLTLLKTKIVIAKKAGVTIMPGGTFFEVAVNQQLFQKYVDTLLSLGFESLEISDGTIDLTLGNRAKYIRLAKNAGLKVFTEYGKKIVGSAINLQELAATIECDLMCGAELITVEGRESGKGVGIYDKNGEFEDNIVHRILELAPSPQTLLWEAPHKDQQIHFIESLGPQVNLGNIPPEDIYSLESLRRGLRSDTFFLGQTSSSKAAFAD